MNNNFIVNDSQAQKIARFIYLDITGYIQNNYEEFIIWMNKQKDQL